MTPDPERPAAVSPEYVAALEERIQRLEGNWATMREALPDIASALAALVDEIQGPPDGSHDTR